MKTEKANITATHWPGSTKGRTDYFVFPRGIIYLESMHNYPIMRSISKENDPPLYVMINMLLECSLVLVIVQCTIVISSSSFEMDVTS